MRRAGLLLVLLVAASSLDAQAVIGQSAYEPHPIQTIDPQTGQAHTLYRVGANLFALAAALDTAGQRLFLRAGTPDFPIFVVLDLTNGDVTTYPFPNIGGPWVDSLFEYDPTSDRVIVNDGYDRFYEVDPDTGAFQLLATIDFGPQDGLFRTQRSALDADANRVHFLVGATLYVGDLDTQTTTSVALPPLDFPSRYAFLHYDPVTGQLLTAAIAPEQPVPPNPTRPVTVSWIDPATGALTPVTVTEPIGHMPDLTGSAFAPDARLLFFLTATDTPSALQLNTVNVSTGAHSVVNVHPGDTRYPWLELWAQAHAGATVPALSPAMLLMLCAALGVAALFVLRRA